MDYVKISRCDVEIGFPCSIVVSQIQPYLVIGLINQALDHLALRYAVTARQPLQRQSGSGADPSVKTAFAVLIFAGEGTLGSVFRLSLCIGYRESAGP